MLTPETEVKPPSNRDLIMVDNGNDLLYWSKELGSTPEKIVASIQKVGNSINAVRRNLKHG